MYVHIYSHTHTCLHTHTMSVPASVPIPLTCNLECPPPPLPARYCPSCKHWKPFPDCPSLPPSPSPLSAHQTHSSGTHGLCLVRVFTLLHVQPTMASKAPMTWPLFAPMCCLLSPSFCSVCFSPMGLLSSLQMLHDCSCPMGRPLLPSATRSWHD